MFCRVHAPSEGRTGVQAKHLLVEIQAAMCRGLATLGGQDPGDRGADKEGDLSRGGPRQPCRARWALSRMCEEKKQ